MTVANHSSPGNFPVIASHDKPHMGIEPPRDWTSLELGDLWRYRELLFFLTWRDIKEVRIAVIGYAYLEDSDDTRNSPSESLVRLPRDCGGSLSSTTLDPGIQRRYL